MLGAVRAVRIPSRGFSRLLALTQVLTLGTLSTRGVHTQQWTLSTHRDYPEYSNWVPCTGCPECSHRFPEYSQWVPRVLAGGAHTQQRASKRRRSVRLVRRLRPRGFETRTWAMDAVNIVQTANIEKKFVVYDTARTARKRMMCVCPCACACV